MHILSIKDYSRSDLNCLMEDSDFLRQNQGSLSSNDLLSGKILATVFFQPSTRTNLSFRTAMLRLHGEVLPFSPNNSRAGASWGEDLRDTARVLDAYADAVVFRHKQAQALYDYAAVSQTPVINGGNGSGQGAEHPTQTLLDLYTIHVFRREIDGVRILMVGDPKIRGARSLCMALAKYQDVTIYALIPNDAQMDQELSAWCDEHGVKVEQINDLDDVIGDIDVLYHHGVTEERDHPTPDCIKLTRDKLSGLNRAAMILHPLPRADELAFDVDHMPQAKYFEQAKFGVYARMAVLQRLFNEQ